MNLAEAHIGGAKARAEASHIAHTDHLRDQFVMAALIGILANPNVRAIHPADVAKLVCQHADAALAERRR